MIFRYFNDPEVEFTQSQIDADLSNSELLQKLIDWGILYSKKVNYGPCPCCGEQKEYSEIDGEYYPDCEDCGVSYKKPVSDLERIRFSVDWNKLVSMICDSADLTPFPQRKSRLLKDKSFQNALLIGEEGSTSLHLFINADNESPDEILNTLLYLLNSEYNRYELLDVSGKSVKLSSEIQEKLKRFNATIYDIKEFLLKDCQSPKKDQSILPLSQKNKVDLISNHLFVNGKKIPLSDNLRRITCNLLNKKTPHQNSKGLKSYINQINNKVKAFASLPKEHKLFISKGRSNGYELNHSFFVQD